VWACTHPQFRLGVQPPAKFYFLLEQLFVNKYKDIILKCSEIFSERYRMAGLQIAMQLESVLSCTSERSTISAVCDFYKGVADWLYVTFTKV